jgi:excisionase family DNA binding protein
MVSFDLIEAAAFLKIHCESLRRLAANGEVPARKVGKRWVFIREHLADYVSGRYIRSREHSLRLVVDNTHEVNKCQYTNEASSTGLNSTRQTEKQYNALLARKTSKKPKSCTTN